MTKPGPATKKPSPARASSGPSKPRARKESSAGRSRRRGWAIFGGVVAAVVSSALAAIILVYPALAGPGTGDGVELEISGDETPSTLAHKLQALGLIDNPELFAFYLRLTGGTNGLAKGPHVLTSNVSPREVMSRLERRSGRRTIRVTFPEGFTRFDMAKRLQDKHVCSLRSFLSATVDGALRRELGIEGESLEGYLFPATYDFPLDSDGAEIVRRMKAEFDRRWSALASRHGAGLTDLQTSLGWQAKDVVVLASLVEKEAAVDDERATIASVFLNRLRDPSFRPKLLQSDPSSAYGCLVMPERAPACAGFVGRVTPAINQDALNRYSTYKHEGLPPGPIANPGSRSLEAVLAPAKTRYFYFVAQGGGRHVFTETYAAHQEAIRATRR